MCDHCGCRSFGPIAELTADHEQILGMAWELAESTRASIRTDERARDDLLAFLDVHVAKEETGLYPALLSTGDVSTEQIGDLEQEHRELREALTTGAFDRRAFYALAAHIEDEEMELFPTAMFGFDDDEWDVMEAASRTASATRGAPARVG